MLAHNLYILMLIHAQRKSIALNKKHNQHLFITLDQLNQIRKTSLAKLLCNNINGVENIQRRAFMMMGTNNPKVKCSEISGIDLSFWNDGES